MGWSRVELLWNGWDLTTKGEQPWPQLVRCASTYCRVCGCVFQEDWIVVRSFGEKWYRLIRVRVGQGEDVNDFNLCQGRNSRGWRCKIIHRNYTLERSNVLCWREVLLSDSIKKALADRQGCWSRERLVERPWLQLMCCALVSSCEVVAYFRVIEVVKTKVLGRQVKGVGVDKERLGPDDINF